MSRTRKIMLTAATCVAITILVLTLSWPGGREIRDPSGASTDVNRMVEEAKARWAAENASNALATNLPVQKPAR